MRYKKQKLIKFIFSNILMFCYISNNFLFAMKRQHLEEPVSFSSFENEFHQLHSVQQRDGWQCGYFAVFNGCRLVESILEIPPQVPTQKFEEWKIKVLEKWQESQQIQPREIYPSIPKNFGEQLNGIQVEDLINLCFDPAISFFDESNNNQDFNVSMIESRYFDKDKIYPENYLYKNIRNFRIFGTPQLIIINLENHWITCLLNQDKKMHGMDSFNTELKTRRLVKQIYNYFVNKELPLEGDDYLDVIKQMRRREKRARHKEPQQQSNTQQFKNRSTSRCIIQ